MNQKRMEEILAQNLELSSTVEDRINETYRQIRVQAMKRNANAARRVPAVDLAKTGGRKKVFKTVALFAATLTLFGCMAAALEEPLNQFWMSCMGVNQEIVGEMIVTDPEIVCLTDDMPLTIQDIYVDGSNLVFSAAAGEEIDYTLYAMDHSTVNGVDCLLYFYQTKVEEGIAYYQGEIKLSQEVEGDLLDITIRLYEKEEIREIRFQTNAEGLQATKWIPDQTFELDYAKIEVTGISAAPSELQMTFDYSFDDYEKAKEFEWQLLYKLENDKGEVLDTMYGSAGYASDLTENGDKWTCRVYLSITGFDYTSEYVKVTPYTPECDSEGRAIPDTGTVHEEKAFTVSLVGEDN